MTSSQCDKPDTGCFTAPQWPFGRLRAPGPLVHANALCTAKQNGPAEGAERAACHLLARVSPPQAGVDSTPIPPSDALQLHLSGWERLNASSLRMRLFKLNGFIATTRKASGITDLCLCPT